MGSHHNTPLRMIMLPKIPDVARASNRGAMANTASAAAILDLISMPVYWMILRIYMQG